MAWVATFGLGTTLAVAAVAAVAVSAAGATKAAQNNIDSQLAKNGGDNSKIDYGEVLKAEFFGAVTGAKDMLKTEACAGTDWAIQTFMGMVGIINQGRKLLPWNHSNMINQIEIDNKAQRINNDANSIHQFFLDNAPDKQAFEGAEYVLDVATIVDGVKSIPKIIKNFPNKFSIGELSLTGLGKTVPVLCVDGSVTLATASDVASIGGAGGVMYNMASNSSGGSGGTKETKTNDSESLTWPEFQTSNKGKFKTDVNGTAKQQMSDAWEEYKKENYPNGGEHYLNDRPNLRKSTLDNIEYETDSEGRILDGNTDEPILDQMDIGHKPGHEAWRCRKAAEELGWSQSQYNEFMNNSKFYRYESHAGNISHTGENKSNDLSEIIE